jgi:hypothetical protein
VLITLTFSDVFVSVPSAIVLTLKRSNLAPPMICDVMYGVAAGAGLPASELEKSAKAPTEPVQNT